MLKLVAGIAVFVLLLVTIPASYIALEKSCSLQHSRNDKNAESADESKDHASPKGQRTNPTATFNLSISEPGKIGGSYYAKDADREKEDWTHKFWCDAKIGEFALVVFTLFLVVFTGGLWWSTHRLWKAGEKQRISNEEIAERQRRSYAEIAVQQHLETRDALTISREAADAVRLQAKVAEESLLKIERPYVLVSNLSNIKPSKITQENVISKPHITYKVGNYGRMPAIIHEIQDVFQISKSGDIPVNPFSINPPHRLLSEGFNAGYAIAAGVITEEQYFSIPNNIEVEKHSGWYDPKVSKGHTVFMFIRIRYEDTGGLVRELVSTWRYDFTVHHFLKCGGKEHNYERASAVAP